MHEKHIFSSVDRLSSIAMYEVFGKIVFFLKIQCHDAYYIGISMKTHG